MTAPAEIIRADEIATEDEWPSLIAEGQRLVNEWERANSAFFWDIGDLALQVEVKYGEGSLAKFAEEVDIDLDILREKRRVAGAFPPGCRIDTTLSWTHHRHLAARPDRENWLERASTHNWSVQKLLQELRKFDRRPDRRKGERENREGDEAERQAREEWELEELEARQAENRAAQEIRGPILNLSTQWADDVEPSDAAGAFAGKPESLALLRAHIRWLGAVLEEAEGGEGVRS